MSRRLSPKIRVFIAAILLIITFVIALTSPIPLVGTVSSNYPGYMFPLLENDAALSGPLALVGLLIIISGGLILAVLLRFTGKRKMGPKGMYKRLERRLWLRQK